MSTASLPAQLPSGRFGQYRILHKVGEGGMAEVFRAEVIDDQGRIQTAILKLMKPDVSDEYIELFDFEADLMGLLDHPNLVKRLEVGRYKNRRFLAMEDVYGGDLRQLLNAAQQEQTPMPLDVALYIVIEILRGLAHFHVAKTKQGQALGLIHSDINPANVFVAVDGSVKLGDFGVASATMMDAVGSGLLSDITVGKLHYLSPEQAAGEAANQTSDLFSLGVTLYELVCGVRPFVAQDSAVLLDRVYAARVEFPNTLAHSALAHIMRRALARSSKDRYQSAGEFCGELVRFVLDNDLQIEREHIQDYFATTLEVVL